MAAIKPKRTMSKKLKASKNKKINKWLILGGIAAVAVIGVAVVRFSSASSYTFVNTSNDKKLSGGKRVYLARTNRYYNTSADNWVSTFFSPTQIKGARYVCFHWATRSGKKLSPGTRRLTASLNVLDSKGGSPVESTYELPSAASGNQCVDIVGSYTASRLKNGGVIQAKSDWYSQEILIDTIYGKK